MTTKKIAAEKAVEYIENNMVIGLGTGSTAHYAIVKIGERVQQGLKVVAVASSIASENLAKEVGIPILPAAQLRPIDVTIDGADEVDAHCNLIKGGGGALLREKIIASNSKTFFVVVDDSKLVKHLGKFRLPVEVAKFGVELTLQQLKRLHCDPVLRKSGDSVFVTDNGNFVADCDFFPIENSVELDVRLKQIPGVVETGLFLHTMVTTVFVGMINGEVKMIKPS